VVELLLGARWLASAPPVTALALLVLVQAPRLLMTPALTALGRPRAPLVGLMVELAVVLVLLVGAGAPTLAWAAAIWVLRELASAPVMTALLGRTIGLGAGAHLRVLAGPLLASALMAAAVSALRPLLPVTETAAGAGLRLAVMAPAGALVFLAAAWLVDRASVRRLLDFLVSIAPRPTLEPR
jgi:O-antigen/teichoic acid export membrane protein